MRLVQYRMGWNGKAKYIIVFFFELQLLYYKLYKIELNKIEEWAFSILGLKCVLYFFKS
jgi:hypothetical protein